MHGPEQMPVKRAEGGASGSVASVSDDDDRPVEDVGDDDGPDNDLPDDEERIDDIYDELPEDLIAAGYVGTYLFPDNNRRRIPGVLHLVIGVGAVIVWATASGSSVLVNGGMLVAGIVLIGVGIFHLAVAWSLKLDEGDALVVAGREVGFPVGHASAQLGWRGPLSRPTWRILVYSPEAQPAKRALVLVDGSDGEVIDAIVEDNPETW